MINTAFEGYELIKDPQTGNEFYIDKNTGECLESISRSIPAGSFIYTPKDQDRHRKQQEQHLKEELELLKNAQWEAIKAKRRTNTPFYFATCDKQPDSLRPETWARLFYLMSFAGYAENGCKLVTGNHKQIQKKDLPAILDVSEPTARKFFNEVSPKYIKDTEQGLIWVDGFFHKGEKYFNSNERYMRIFCEHIQKLYKTVKNNGIKFLGYIFCMLYYVNMEHNILCFNPLEKDIEKVQRMNLRQFCEIIGYDIHNIDRLYKALDAPTFEINGREQWFFRLLLQPHSKDYTLADIGINPKLLYSGSDMENVKALCTAYDTGRALRGRKRKEITSQKKK